jgi:hypothetical protein
MTRFRTLLARSLPLPALCAAALLSPSASAQGQCGSAISADVAQISLSGGGVQNIVVTVRPEHAELGWHVLGALGTDQPHPQFAYGDLRLNSDRYLWRMYTGNAGFVQGALPGYIGGPLVLFDAQGQAHLQVVVPSNLPSSWIGRTLHHGVYLESPLTLLPTCGSGTVAVTIVP